MAEGTVVITGVAGFIGWRTALRFLEAGYRVVGIDNLDPYYDVLLKEKRLEDLKRFDGFQFVHADFRDGRQMESVFRAWSPEGVLHLGAKAGVRPSLAHPEEYYSVNVMGTLGLLELVRTLEIPYFLFASTSSVYAGVEPPFHEGACPRVPRSPYASSKLAAETMVQTWSRLYGLRACIVRYFTVYGPGGRPDMLIFRLLYCLRSGQALTIYGDGSQRRSFTYIDDIVEGTWRAYRWLVEGCSGYDGVEPVPIVNLGHPEDVSLRQLFETVARIAGGLPPLQFTSFHKADMKVTRAQIDRARRWLAWTPSTPVEEGIERTWHWFEVHWQWLKDVRLP